MIPYLPEPVLNVAELAIHASGACAAAALISGYAIVRRRAHRFHATLETASWLYLAAVIAGLAAGALWDALASKHGLSATGLSIGGSLGLLIGIRHLRSPLWATLDVFVPAFAQVMAIARVGCFLAHDHLGNATDSWLGVAFPGGTRWDLGLLYALSTAAIALALGVLQRWDLSPGALTAMGVLLLGASRLSILPLGDAAPLDYAVAMAAVACGVAVAGSRKLLSFGLRSPA